MDELEERQRAIALELAVKLAHNLPDTDTATVSRAREFYGFLSGDKDAPVSSGTYSVTINNPIKRSF